MNHNSAALLKLILIKISDKISSDSGRHYEKVRAS